MKRIVQCTKDLLGAVMFRTASLYQRLHRRTHFIGVTGSCGKTSTVNLIHGCLVARRASVGIGENQPGAIALALLLRLRPWNKYHVQEVAGSSPEGIQMTLEFSRWKVAVVTTIGDDHYTNFRGKDRTALEKGRLVEQLPEDGIAILNADDAHVLAMRHRTRARVLTYGRASDAWLRAVQVSSNWPERLRLTVQVEGETHSIRTRLLGELWEVEVLAALATLRALGIPMKEAIAGIESVEPYPGRMSAQVLESGITFIRDDCKAPYWTFPAVFDFVENAQAERKVIVVGTISDYPGSSAPRYRKVARRACRIAHKVLFVGPNAERVRKEKTGAGSDRLLTFPHAYGAHRFLETYLRPGDLVLLKGSLGADHLERIVHARIDPEMVCWRERCGRRFTHCTKCRLYRSPHLPPAAHDEAFPGSMAATMAPGGESTLAKNGHDEA